MYKKTLLSLAVASTVGLTGCFSDGGSKNAGASTAPPTTLAEQGTYPVFNPVTSELPLPNDLIFDSEAGDGSFSVDIGPADEGNPVLEALNKLSGASTVAPAVIRFNGDIDASTVDSQAFIMQGGTPAPNPNQNVFLLETEYPSEEPVRALSAGEPPTLPVALTAQLAGGATLTAQQEEAVSELIGNTATPANAGAYLAGLTSNRRFDHDVVELDGTSAIRIRPNQPLDPLKRYVVVVTDGVKTPSGDPVNSSPTYNKLSQDDEGTIDNEGLQSVRTLINSFWEKTAGSYFQLTNNSREQAGLDPISADNIAVSYSFTTSQDEDVLTYIAEPAKWIEDQVRRSVKTQAASAAVQGGASGFSAARQQVNAAVSNFTPSDLNDDLMPCDPSPTPFQCVGSALKGSLSGGGINFASPKARTFSLGAATPSENVSPVLTNFGGTNVSVLQGSITLPYYLGVPSASNPAPIRTQDWSVNSGAAAAIADATGFAIPQANPDISQVLNYNFPFPKKQSDIEVPLLVMAPDGVSSQDLRDGNGYDAVVMYQHGITTDRSAMLAFGSSVIANGLGEGTNIVFVGIDQPLHGIDPDGSTIPSGITPVYEDQGVNSSGATERHFGFEADAQGNADNPQPMNFGDDAVGGSGSLFINLSNFLVGRDVLRQGSLDLMNVRKTLEAKWAGATQANTFLVGHSLGTQTGGVFAGAAQDSGRADLGLAGVHLMTPVAGVVSLLENSPSFAPQILGGLQAAAGLTQGDASLETFLNVNQLALDSADPINYSENLANLNLLIGQINGDRTTPNAADDRYSGNVQGYDTQPLDITLANGFQINSFAAPLTGSEALAKVVNANSVQRGAAVQVPAISRYLEGVHGTPVIPQPETAEAGDVLKDRTLAAGGETVVSAPNAQAAFGEMVVQTLGLIGTAGPAADEITGGGSGNPGIIQDGN